MRALCLAVLVVLAGPAAAEDFFKSSPGELSRSHATLDKDGACNECHDGSKAIVAAKCLGCHDHQNLAQRISRGEGFHASAKVKGRECSLCHKEHRGKSFDLMGWQTIGGTAKFDHAQTGWPLGGKHATTSCEGCHKTVNKQGLRTYLSTDKTCGSCHDKDSPHGKLRAVHERCERCHTQSIWKPAKPKLDFDHDDATQAAMPLQGVHAEVACAKCHPKATFRLVAFQDGACSQCHESPHDGQLFGTKKCQTCHSAALKTFDDVSFDHKKQTGYALAGKHAQIACASCHTKALGSAKPKGACETCHADDNKHGARFDKLGSPPPCTTCHSQRAWKSGFQFNHAANSGFALTAKHAATACRSCHRGKTPAEFERFDIKQGCMSCHRHAKAHGGDFKNDECLRCHAEGGSKRLNDSALEIYHGEKSKFPLRNAHAGVKCQLCHVNDVYQNTPMECGVSCHEDSLHKGTLGQTCSRCHEPGQWRAVRFDHAVDTKWKLEGKHTEIKACEACHPARQYKGAPTSCGAAGCHEADDAHEGKLGDKCERCHHVDGKTTFRHDRDASFKVDGAHRPLLCASCHPSLAFKPVRSDCFGCHPEPAVHKGRYGTACERCHSTTTFANVKAMHDVGDFSLTGAHDGLDCARCHPAGEARRGSGNLCITCHRKDDIHRNSLSPRCGECHTQRAFAPARFDHVQVGCGLTGLHGTLPCADCHRQGNFGAVSPICASCHRRDALRVRTPDHRTLVDCGNCHNPTAWIPANQHGAQSLCR